MSINIVVKKILIGLIITIAYEIKAMDAPIPDAQQNICDLARLPIEIRDHIAQFLPFKDRETEQELIERTAIPQEIDDSYFDSYCALERSQNFSASHGVRAAFCLNRSKIAFIELLCGRSRIDPTLRVHPKLTVARCKKEDGKICLEVIHREDLQDQKKLEGMRIALSPCGNLIARVNRRQWAGDGQTVLEHDVVAIKNITTGVWAERSLGGYGDTFEATSLDFNKQGTQIIVHGKLFHKQKDTPMVSTGYWIFPVFLVELKEKREAKRKKTFDEYLRQHYVCKKITDKM